MTAALAPSASPPHIDVYAILGLAPGTSREGIKVAYKTELNKLRQSKPSPSELDEKLQLLTEAYAILSNDSRRNSYDATFIPAVSPPTSRPTTPSFSVRPPRPPSVMTSHTTYEPDEDLWRDSISNAGGDRLMGHRPGSPTGKRRDYTVEEPSDRDERPEWDREYSVQRPPLQERAYEARDEYHDRQRHSYAEPARDTWPTGFWRVGDRSVDLEDRLHSLVLGEDRGWTNTPSAPWERERSTPSRPGTTRRASTDGWAQPPRDIFGPSPWGHQLNGEVRGGRNGARQVSARMNEGEKRSNGDYHVKKSEHHLSQDADETVRFSSYSVATRYISGRPHSSDHETHPSHSSAYTPDPFYLPRSSSTTPAPSSRYSTVGRPAAIRQLESTPAPAPSRLLSNGPSINDSTALVSYNGQARLVSSPGPESTSLARRPPSPAASTSGRIGGVARVDLTKRALASPSISSSTQLVRREGGGALTRSASVGAAPNGGARW